MISIAVGYFSSANRQPAKDVRLLKSLDVDAICLQDAGNVKNFLVEEFTYKVASATTITMSDKIEMPTFSVDDNSLVYTELGHLKMLNVDLSKARYSGAESAKKYADTLLETRLDVICGNFELLCENTGWYGKRKPSKIFKKLGMQFINCGPNFFAWNGEESPKVQILESKNLGSDQDWMVVTFE